MADYYEILGIARTASSAEVRKAYAVIARERHPDRFTDPEQRKAAQAYFTDATSAFNTLASDTQRREYDLSLSRPRLDTPERIAEDAFKRGQAAMEQKDFHTAVELFKVAADRQPAKALHHAALAQALARNPRWAREAATAWETALKMSPKNAAWHVELGRLLAAQGLKLRARRAFEAALAVAPDDASAREELLALDPEPPAPAPGGLSGLLRRK
ncbi:MAG: DnaJ domain-containing protein [Vicinamibacteria bacterium]|nr:DnaJ domain-containing protein [Vicinamibacteria bacterium]